MPNRNNVLITNQVITGTGAETESRPSVAFGDTDTGLYESTDDKLHVTLGGTERFVFSGADFTKADGTKYITSAVVGADAITDTEVSGEARIRLNKLVRGVTGQVLIFGTDTQISGLAVGTAGQFLTTQGTGANPTWTTQAAGGIQKRYTFSGQAAAGADTNMGLYRIPAGTFVGTDFIFLNGCLRGSNADGIMRLGVSGSARVNTNLTLITTNQEGFAFKISQANPSSNTEIDILATFDGTASKVNGSGTLEANWITKDLWISGCATGVSGTTKPILELWY